MPTPDYVDVLAKQGDFFLNEVGYGHHHSYHDRY